MYEPDFNNPIDINEYLVEELGMCGCSEIEPFARTLKLFLKWHNDDIVLRKSYDELFENTGIFYLLSGMMDNANLTEHGTSIRYSWLTEKGETLLDGLNKYSVKDIENASGIAYDGCYVGHLPT